MSVPRLPIQKTIGLLGGTSWPSTIEYYRTLNTLINRRLGGFHSARLAIHSIDYHDIKSSYGSSWNVVPSLLEQELKVLDSFSPGCILICNNTLHKAYDSLSVNLGATVIHIVEAVGRAAQARGLTNLLLLGTKLTMEDGFYQDRLKEFGCQVSIPSESERDLIQAIQSRLAAGEVLPQFKDDLVGILRRHSEIDAAILGCTELPLAIAKGEAPCLLLNSIDIHCTEAVKFALELT